MPSASPDTSRSVRSTIGTAKRSRSPQRHRELEGPTGLSHQVRGRIVHRSATPLRRRLTAMLESAPRTLVAPTSKICRSERGVDEREWATSSSGHR